MSRRQLLSRAGAAAVGLVVAGALSEGDILEARANHFGAGINVDFVWAHHEGERKIAVLGEAPAGTGVKGTEGSTAYTARTRTALASGGHHPRPTSAP